MISVVVTESKAEQPWTREAERLKEEERKKKVAEDELKKITAQPALVKDTKELGKYAQSIAACGC